ncbi:hypothetical protein NFI96_024162, partial [Prochilodus magdalenae]
RSFLNSYTSFQTFIVLRSGLWGAHALQCYDCKLGFWDVCVTKNVTCDPDQACYSGTGKAAGIIKLKMKGCLKVSECNKTSDVNFPSDSNTTIYKMTKTCCSTDMCNAAPGLSLHTLMLAFASLTSLLAAKVLL